MIKFKNVEHIDEFDDIVVYWVDLDDRCISKQNIKEAKLIDGSNYDLDCFGICINYNKHTHEFDLVTDTERNIYYIDNYGDKNWMYEEISQKELDEIISQINISIRS